MTSRRPRKARPCVLIVAGLDPSGGAGLAADQRAVLSTGAWACPVCATITVQSTAGLVSVHPVDPGLVLAQAREVLEHQRVRAIKTGALGSTANVRAVIDLLRDRRGLPSVVDPVIVATRGSGARLLESDAGEALAELLSLATVVTPNLDEASELLGRSIRDEADLPDAARELHKLGPRAVLLKGGHLRGARAVDVLYAGGRVYGFGSDRLRLPPFHGGGCTLASLIAGELAMAGGKATHDRIVDSVGRARQALQRSIGDATRIGRGLLVLPVR
jgi:hydroxymethylpyrimidine kinase/phosphomethylpyrimidine kinase